MRGQLFSLDAFAAFSILIACLGLFLVMEQAMNSGFEKDEMLKVWDASQILVKDALVNKSNPNIIIDISKINEVATFFNLTYVSISGQQQPIYGQSCQGVGIKRPIILNTSQLEFGWLEVCG